MMWQSGLILAVVMLLAGAGVSLLSPLCVPCLSIFAGLGAGFLACVFDKPGENGAAVKAGALAGTIGGIGALLGQVVGGVLNSAMTDTQAFEQMYQQFGLPFNESSYWAGRITGVCCGGAFDIILMVGLGALGGLLWWQISGKKAIGQSGAVGM